MEPAQVEQLRKTLGHVFGHDDELERPGSAPPQVVNDVHDSPFPMSPFAGMGHVNAPLSGNSQGTSHHPGGGGSASMFGIGENGRNKEPLSQSDPDYVRYYYANRNINPRLPPPLLATSQRGQWLAAKNFDSLQTAYSADQVLHDQAGGQSSLNNLFNNSINFKGDAEADALFLSHQGPVMGGGEQLPVGWVPNNARPGPGDPSHMDILLQGFSPSKGGSSSLYASINHEDHTFNEDSLFGGGSNTQSPRHSAMGSHLVDSRHFDTTVGSPPTGMRSNSAAACLGSQDPKMLLRRKMELPQSKLRMASTAADSPLQMDVVVSGISTSDPQTSVLSEALQNLPQGLLSGMMQGMGPDQQTAAAMSGMPGGPDGMAALMGGVPGGMPNQLQAMYMASMYPFFAQQAAIQFPYMGMPGLMGFPGGYPMMPPPPQGPGHFSGMPGMMPDMMGGGGGYPGMMPGGYPGMPGMPLQFSGMPGMMPGPPPGGGGGGMPPEYAAYYQKMVEAQAAAAMGGGGDMLGGGKGGGDHNNGDLNGYKMHGGGGHDLPHFQHMPHMQQHQHHGDGGRDGSPMGRRGRDLSSDQGRGGSGLDSPHRREGGGSGSARKNSRREEDKRADVVLEEFKNNKGKRFEFADIFGHVYEFSLDQHGSRFIQQKLETAPHAELTAAFEEVLPRVITLITDVFGNYVVQKFLDHGDSEHRLKLAKALQGNVLAMSLQMYGCRVVQKALEVLPTEVQCEIMGELDGQVMRCVRDQNGNHVIQKIIECVPTARVVHLLDSFLTCVVPLSSHPFGCRVIQRILEHCQDERRRAGVMDDILRSTCQLAQDQYGNYVIQHVLERGTPAERMRIVTQLAPQIVSMSMHKFASNVVEKCLIFCSGTERDVLIRSMLGTSSDEASEEEDPLQQMMKDQFGNYVVQKVLELCDDVQRELMLSRVRLQLHALKKYTYGKHIVARVEKLLATGTKLQTSSKLSGRPLPDDDELHALQMQLNLMHRQKQQGLAGAGGEEAQAGEGGGVGFTDAKAAVVLATPGAAAGGASEGAVGCEGGVVDPVLLGSKSPAKEAEVPKGVRSEVGYSANTAAAAMQAST